MPVIELEKKLKEFFGYNDFRNHQKEIIQAALDQKDVLAVLPTGAGKSLCYQLPAMLMPGTAIVISPLISLMQDQVISLYKNGIPAAFLNSSLNYQDIQEVLSNLKDYKLIYIAPERLADPAFIQSLKEIDVSLFVIDEAHCISQWGHSFRNEYRKLSVLKELFPEKPVMALTATATSEVEQDIVLQLAMKNRVLVKGSFDRPNLTIRINQKMNVEKQLSAFLQVQKEKSGIIYAATRKTVDETFQRLERLGVSVGRYHAGMSDKDRMDSQNNFLHDKVQIMVATVAFGMGIHKPDVRFIVHMDMPRSIEQYYQEIGRAGRDGLPAECLMFFGAQDIVVYKVFLDQLEDPEIRELTRKKTEKIYRLCTSLKCRRKELLIYFGEKYPSDCMSCDNCVDDVDMLDGSVIAQKILSCVFRLRQNFGIRTVIDVLRGAKSQTIIERGHDQLSTYGLLSDLPEKEVRYYLESLIHMGFLKLTEGDYPVLKWSETSASVIENRQPVLFKKKIFKEVKVKESLNITLNYDIVLFNALKALRTEIARNEKVPPYVVFSDRALQEMAVHFPKSRQAFSKINGVGPIKWVKYGEKFLSKICEITGSGLAHTPERTRSPIQRRQSAEETMNLYKQGHNLDSVAAVRQLTKHTVIEHLVECIEAGSDLDISSTIPMEKKKRIEEIIESVGFDKLSPIKERLPENYSYDEIRLVVAFYRRK
jgi:ATP-dependent DNA helicase RecQ